jgi:predicted nucleic acid-binding protein
MPRIVALDTNILTWALKEKATSGQEEMIPRCQAFLTWLDRRHDIILVPEIVISELLMDIPEDQHTDFLSRIDNLGFLTQPHDRHASLLAARMWRKCKQMSKTGITISRKQLRVDILILAAAIAGQASIFYTNNTKDFIRFSGGFSIEISDIPLEDETAEPQLPLFHEYTKQEEKANPHEQEEENEAEKLN